MDGAVHWLLLLNHQLGPTTGEFMLGSCKSWYLLYQDRFISHTMDRSTCPRSVRVMRHCFLGACVALWVKPWTLGAKPEKLVESDGQLAYNCRRHKLKPVMSTSELNDFNCLFNSSEQNLWTSFRHLPPVSLPYLIARRGPAKAGGTMTQNRCIAW